jgi:hypothetical protein
MIKVNIQGFLDTRQLYVHLTRNHRISYVRCPAFTISDLRDQVAVIIFASCPRWRQLDKIPVQSSSMRSARHRSWLLFCHVVAEEG